MHAKPKSHAGEDLDEIAFRLVSVETARTPEGCAGRDWLVYRIAQGANVIMGYRRGTREAVTAEVEQIVRGLNERRVSGKGRPGPKRGRPAAAATATAASAAEPADE